MTDDISRKPTNPLAATWTVANSQDAGGISASTVALSFRPRPAAARSADARSMSSLYGDAAQPVPLALDIDPEAGVEEGEPFELAVLHGPIDESLSAADLHYAVGHGQQWRRRSSRRPRRSTTANWDTTGVASGTHSVTARLVDERGRPVMAETGPGAVTGTALDQGVAAEQERRDARGAAASGHGAGRATRRSGR